MYLYNKTLVAGSNINSIALGRFLGRRETQLVVLRGTTLSLYNLIDMNCYHLISRPIFGIGRCISTLHLIDYSKDLIVLTSDSGCLTILEFDLDSFEFQPLVNYKIGNAGCIKNVPGQYLQISPDNRFIAVCAISEMVAVYPVQYSLSVDRRSIQFSDVKPFVYSLKNALIYDIAWSDDNDLCLFATHCDSHIQIVHSLRLENGVFSDNEMINITQEIPDKVVTRIMWYDHHLVLLCENCIIINIGSEKNVFVFSSPQDSTIITAFCKSQYGLILGTDNGNVFYHKPDCLSFLPIANPLAHNGYATHLCCTETTLYIFSNNGKHTCIPLDRLSNTVVDPNSFHLFLSSISYCNHLTPMGPGNQYIGSIGSGKHGCIGLINEGLTFALKPINISNNRDRSSGVLINHVYSLPSLANELVDNFFILSLRNETILYRIKESSTSFEVVQNTPFVTKETTLNMGCFQNMYIQITPSSVLALTGTERLDTWETTPDARIENSYIGKDTIVLVRKKQSVLCLRWERGRFVVLEEFSSDSVVTCVLEYDQYILVGSSDRSIRVFRINGNSASEVSYLAIKSIPQSLFSFKTAATGMSMQGVTSNDDTIFVGCNEGYLIMVSFKQDKPELEMIKTTRLDASNSVVSFSYTIFNSMPTLFILSQSHTYLVYRSQVYDFIPVTLDMVNRQPNPTGDSTRNNKNGFVVYKTAEQKNIMFCWKKGALFNGDYNTTLSGATVRPTPSFTDCTCRGILSSSPRHYLSFCGDYIHSSGYLAKNLLQSFDCNDNGQIEIRGYNCPLFTGEEVMTAVTVGMESSKDVGETKRYMIIGSMDPLHQSYFISYHSYSEQSTEMIMRWHLPVEAKVFKLLSLSSPYVAMVIGSYLRVYQVSEPGVALVAQIKCTSSFVTAIHFENNRFYIIDNSGVISVILYAKYAKNPLIPILRHETHRSLMRCCVIDDISVAVGDKYGNILIYRSLFPMDYLLNTSDPKAQESRMNTTCSMTLMAAFYVGEVITSLFTEMKNGMKVITYCTIYGRIGCLFPIHNMNDLEILVALESLILGRNISLVGRVVDDFRSTYVPCMSIVDGSVCRMFFSYSKQQQQEIADQLEMTISEVKEKLLEISNMESDSQKMDLNSQ